MLKKMILVGGLGLCLTGCVSHRLRCRLVVVDKIGRILKDPKPGPWRYGVDSCKARLEFLTLFPETPYGPLGVEVRGTEKQRKELAGKGVRIEPPSAPTKTIGLDSVGLERERQKQEEIKCGD